MSLLFLIVLIVFLIITLGIDKLMSSKNENLTTYNDNGKRVRIIVNTLPNISQTDDCTPHTLKTCTIGDLFSCGKCKEPLASCHHFANDMNIDAPGYGTIFIQANKSKEEGYCLALNSSGSARACTRKNGGKWILVLNESQTLYRFECFCSQHNYFVNSPIDNDCTQFIGCVNGKMKTENWNKLEEIDCECKTNYESSRLTPNFSVSEAPQCVLKNIFRWEKPPFPVIQKEFVSTSYLQFIQGDVHLPDPCQFDLRTNTFNSGIGQAVLDEQKNIVYCRPMKIGYATAITNSDYLLNNNGAYANCIISFTDNISDLEKRKNDELFEYQRTKIYTPDNILRGVRLYYKDFKFKLSYLERDSMNMNGPGVYFAYAPTIPKERMDKAYVYIYNAQTPTPITSLDEIGKWGTMLYWSPFFNTTGGSEANNRVYNGIMPLAHYSDPRQMILLPNVPVAASCKKLAGFNGLQKAGYVHAEEEKWAVEYALPLTLGNYFKTKLNTGILLRYTPEGSNEVFAKPISIGNLVRTQRYRRNYNKDFSELHGATQANRWMYYRTLHCDDLQLASKKTIHMWPETSYGYELGEVGCVRPAHGRYTATHDDVEFCDFYS